MHYKKMPIQNILKISPPKKKKKEKKTWKFSDKNSDIFHISAQNIDGRGGPNKYP